MIDKCTLVFLFVAAALLTPYAARSAELLAPQIDSLLSAPELSGGTSSVLVQSLRDGRVVYGRNPDQHLIPASNLKIVTSAAALDRLGKDFRFDTRLYAAGKVDARGVLHGDLWLLGGGDPRFSMTDLDGFVKAVKDAGIKKVIGRIVADESRFDNNRLGAGWNWDDEPYYYCAQVAALNLQENVVQVFLRPGRKSGLPAIVTLVPPTRYLRVRNDCQTGPTGSESAVIVTRERGQNTIVVTGSVPLGLTSRKPAELITVESPAEYAAAVFRESLIRAGVPVLGGIGLGKLPSETRVLATHKSEPLLQILPSLNKSSDNLIAEALLKTLGAECKGLGTWPNGIAVVMEFLGKTGVDSSTVAIVDGSGLSRLNCLTTRVLVGTLRYMADHPDAALFAESLPTAGVDGTLARRMTESVAQGQDRAKTGYVIHVSALSGYLTAESGERFAFSIIMNNHLCANRQATAIQDRICELLVQEL